MRMLACCLAFAAAGFAQDRSAVDWHKLEPEILANFTALLKIDTSNPPGNETQAAKAIQEVLDGGTVLEPIIAKRFWNYFQSVQGKPTGEENPWGLTPAELEVLRYVAKGLSNAEVGKVMTIERRTVRTLLSHVYRKMGVNSHVEAVVKALRAGVVEI